jgi:hypothetical protein
VSAAVATAAADAIRRPDLAETAQRLFESKGSTLEEIILGAWEDLSTRGRARCPVCRGEVLSAAGCEGCGSQLS